MMKVLGLIVSSFVLFVFLGCSNVTSGVSVEDGTKRVVAESAYSGGKLLKTPNMGMSTWMSYGRNFNLATIEQTADAMVSQGLLAKGYNIVWLDDGWMNARNSDGTMNPRFDIAAAARYVHSKGMKFGIYTDIRVTGYSGLLGSGSGGHIQDDMDQFVAWGCDAVKIDRKYDDTVNGDNSPGYTSIHDAFIAFSKAVNNRMIINFCDAGYGKVPIYTYAMNYANIWRNTHDVARNSWASLLNNFTKNLHPEAQSPGAYNDPDYLVNEVNATEQRTQFSLWCLMGSPLMLGLTEIRNMTASDMSIYGNDEMIAIDQDPLSAQCTQVSGDSTLQVYKKDLSDPNSKAVVLFNQGSSSANIAVTWSTLGLPSRSSARDIWAAKDLGILSNGYTANVPSHGVVVLKVTAVQGGIATYEAESGTLGGVARLTSANYCSGGYKVGYIGHSANSCIINNVNVAAAGNYVMTIYYCVNNTRNFEISVDGGAISTLPCTGSSFSAVFSTTMNVHLNAGNNSITFGNLNAYAPDLDRITIQ